MQNKNLKNIFAEHRLVWMSPAEGGPAPAEPPKPDVQTPPEKIDYNEKLVTEPDKITELANRVKSMNIAETKVLKDTDKGAVTVLKFRAALKEVIKGEAEKLNVKNLDDFLLNGLLENLGPVDAKISTMGPAESKNLADFLKKNNVVSFSIENGYWKFFKNSGEKTEPVKADYKLDGEEGSPVVTAVLGSAVKKVKEADVKAAADKAAADKAEADRQKPETLEKVNSNASVKLAEKMTLDDLVKPMEKTVTPDGGKPAILSDEMKQSLSSYVEGYSLGDAEKNFAAFLKDLIKDGYKNSQIVKGRIAFSKDGQRYNANPLDLAQGGVKTELYAHPEMGKTRLEEAQKKIQEQTEAAKDKKTPFDDAELQAVKIITGKETPDERDRNNANIDARYLPAIKSILAYPLNGTPVDVKIPFNDRNPLDCKFYAAADGSYVLSWENGQGFYPFKPSVKGEAGLKEAQRFFVANLNNGRVFQEVQRINVNDKTLFETWGMEVDKGPKPKDGGTYYEFDWKGSDPDVVIYTEPHGALRVVVDRKNVGPDGKDHYEFRSGGFQDMIRTLKRVQRWAESEGQERDNMRDGERDARFFENTTKGVMANRAESMRRGAGKLLNVVSVRNFEPNGRVSNDVFARGYMLDFDWMQKVVPPIRLQMFRNGTGNFEYYLMPAKQKLGESDANATPQEALTNALVLVAQQRELLMTQGGEKQREGVFQDLLKAAKENEVLAKRNPFVLKDGVTVEGVSALGTVQLRLPGATVALPFNLGTKDKPNIIEFNRAEQTGYLARIPVEVSRAQKNQAEQTTTPPEAPADKVDVRMPVSPEAKNHYVVRIEFYAERMAALRNVLNANLKGDSYDAIKSYVGHRLHSFQPQEKGSEKANKDARTAEMEKKVWAILAEITGVSGEVTDSKTQTSILTKIKNMQGRKAVEQSLMKDVEIGDQKLPMPQTELYVAGLLAGLAENKGDFTDAQFTKLQGDYKDQVMAIVKELMKNKVRKPNELSVKYDQRILQEAKRTIKLPAEYLRDVKANEKQRKVYEKYQDEQKNQQTLQTEYQESLTKPHLMSLDELEAKPVAGMVAEGLSLFKSIKSVQRTDVFFSRMKGNNLMARDEACFNVLAANPEKPGEKMWMTVHVFREGGELRVSASDGLNNVSRSVNRDWVSAGETAVDQALARGWSRHQGLNTDTMAIPQQTGNDAPTVALPAQPASQPQQQTTAQSVAPTVQPATPASKPAASPSPAPKK